MKRAMILAAGRGERMGELTRHTPKPLLRVAGRYLIEHAILKLKNAGFLEIVINISYFAEQIKSILGDGSQYGINIFYSEEAERLETGGGIFKALSLLGDQPFLVLSCDVVTDYSLQQLPQHLDGLAHLVMVPNPVYHPHGDYGLQDGRLTLHAQNKLTFGNIGIYHPALFVHCKPGHFRLTQLLNPAIEAGRVTGELFQGAWHNVGTPADLALLSS